MNPRLIYEKFLLKVNKGATNADAAIDTQRFCLIFNECKNRWVEKGLKNKDSILIDALYQVIKTTVLQDPITSENYCEFTVPEDYYQFIGATVLTERNKCRRNLFIREVKNQNKQILRFDLNQAPDFDYEWTFCSIQSGVIRIYKREFDIINTSVEYYSTIPDIDIAGAEDIDGNPTRDIPLDVISDQYIDQIINLAAEEFMRDFQNPQGIQIAENRTNSEK